MLVNSTANGRAGVPPPAADGGGTPSLPVDAASCPFRWTYLPGSDRKSQLAYPNDLTASWTYDANSQLLQVCNATPTNVISQYDYTYDAAGRRIACARSGGAVGTPSPTVLSDVARTVLEAGRKLWRYSHAQPKANPNASCYDIRRHFQGMKKTASGKEQMNPTAPGDAVTGVMRAGRRDVVPRRPLCPDDALRGDRAGGRT